MEVTVADFLDSYVEDTTEVVINGWYGDERIIHFRRPADPVGRNSVPMILCKAQVEGVFVTTTQSVKYQCPVPTLVLDVVVD